MAVRGWVYVMTNESMPGLVKVGYSTKDPGLRAIELDGTGVPTPWCVAYDALVIDPRQIEGKAHKHLKDVHHAKEFFRCSIEVAVAAIRSNADIILENSTATMEHSSPTQDNAKGGRHIAMGHLTEALMVEKKERTKAIGGYLSTLTATELAAQWRVAVSRTEAEKAEMEKAEVDRRARALAANARLKQEEREQSAAVAAARRSFLEGRSGTVQDAEDRIAAERIRLGKDASARIADLDRLRQVMEQALKKQ